VQRLPAFLSAIKKNGGLGRGKPRTPWLFRSFAAVKRKW
jgi:hypothetical protein